MNCSNFKKFFSLLMSSAFCVGMLCACGDDPEPIYINVPSCIVANGDYLISSVSGGDYDFKIDCYWDGELIQTSEKELSLKYYIDNQTVGDHKLRIHFSGEVTEDFEFFIQVYEKEQGFFGCNFIREVKNGKDLQGEVIYHPSISEDGNKNKWRGTLKGVTVWIDDDKENAIQTITNAPWIFNIPINNLSKGQHKLTIVADGVSMIEEAVGAGGGLGGLKIGVSYNFTVTE